MTQEIGYIGLGLSCLGLIVVGTLLIIRLARPTHGEVEDMTVTVDRNPLDAYADDIEEDNNGVD